uniref:non-specific serine/threonine protein kinase n=2 Tax=Fagus sylvatica TaxID=28930 RepID=A0A2N9FDR8_FAGSY
MESPVGQLLDSGNLVVKDGNNVNLVSFVWQSFDYPCDTLLPGMKIGRNLVTGFDWFLSSWKSTDDPAPGEFTLRLNLDGFPQGVVTKGQTVIYRTGSWNGVGFTGLRALTKLERRHEFVMNDTEIYYRFWMRRSSIFERVVLNPFGVVQGNGWNSRSIDWQIYLTVPTDQCDSYNFCGAYAICNVKHAPACECLEGFIPKSPKSWNQLDWTGGCIKTIPLACNNGDGFRKYTGLKLPDTSSSCGEGSGCLLWFDTLIDMRITDSLQDVYVRVAASELDQIKNQRHSSKKKKAVIVASSVTLVMGMVILGLILFILKKKDRKEGFRKDNVNKGREEDPEFPVFDLTIILNATHNFSNDNKLGEGGFGPVYRGTLMEGQEIAVKRLSKNSRQGVLEFKNEVQLIAKLQHRNLVKLLDKTRSKLLNWHTRMNIVGGIARGLLYLHQDSRLRIIHRDIKASNILLDKDMNPKISDFGMARTFWGDQTEENTKRIVGTYGYISPEYAVDGLFSIKSDVFSFGVIVLEIVSGKKNRKFFHADHNHNLLGHAWRLWIEERPLELLDEVISDSFTLSEVLRCIHVGLLCVQQQPSDRPDMSSVVLMLGSESLLPSPKQPGFYTERNPPEADSCSINGVSYSLLEAR